MEREEEKEVKEREKRREGKITCERRNDREPVFREARRASDGVELYI